MAKQNKRADGPKVVLNKPDLKGKPGSGVTKVNKDKGKFGGKTGNTKPLETNKQQIKNLKSKLKTDINPKEKARIDQRINFLGGGKGGKNGGKKGNKGKPQGPAVTQTTQPPPQQTTPNGMANPPVVTDPRPPPIQLPPNTQTHTNPTGMDAGPGSPPPNITGSGQLLPGGVTLPPAAPDMGNTPGAPTAAELNNLKTKNAGGLYNADVGGELDESKKQIALQNPDQYNPFGSQTTRMNPDGSISVVQNLSQDQQKILDQDEALAKAGRGIAQDQISNFQQPWDANTADRQFQGGFGADRMRIEDAVYQNLTRDNSKMKQQEREDLERTMFNRGIALDPRNEQYAKSQENLDKRYDSLDQQARLQATQFGGNEMAQQFGQQEQLIANQFAQGQAQRNQQLGELGQFANFSVGQQTPSFQGYQGPNYDVNDPSSYVYGARDYKEANQNQQIQKNQFGQTMDYNYDALGQQMAMQERAIAAAKASTQAPSQPAFPTS